MSSHWCLRFDFGKVRMVVLSLPGLQEGGEEEKSRKKACLTFHQRNINFLILLLSFFGFDWLLKGRKRPAFIRKGSWNCSGWLLDCQPQKHNVAGMVQTHLLLLYSGLLPLYNTEVKSIALSNEGLFPFYAHLLAVFGLRCCSLLYQGCSPPLSFCSDHTYCLVVPEHGSPSIMLHTDTISKKGQGLKAILVEPVPLLCSPRSSTLCKSLITP